MSKKIEAEVRDCLECPWVECCGNPLDSDMVWVCMHDEKAIGDNPQIMPEWCPLPDFD